MKEKIAKLMALTQIMSENMNFMGHHDVYNKAYEERRKIFEEFGFDLAKGELEDMVYIAKQNHLNKKELNLRMPK